MRLKDGYAVLRTKRGAFFQDNDLMQSTTPLHLQDIRIAALSGSYVEHAPREERFDRITRTLRRVMQVPIALFTAVEEDEQWLRSVQGLPEGLPQAMSMFGRVAASGGPVIVADTWADPQYAADPMVIGPPGIRSFVSWPLESAPGEIGGVLYGLDTMPRLFGEDEIAGLKDLARIAECELRAHATASLQQTLMLRLELVQRRHALDPFTGCWSIRGFRELLGLAVSQAHADGTQLALCHLRVEGLDVVVAAMGEAQRTSVLSVISQWLRERLPMEGALARLTQADFCAMVPAGSAAELEHLLAPVIAPELGGLLPDGRRVEISVAARVTRLSDAPPEASASKLWGATLADSSFAP